MPYFRGFLLETCFLVAFSSVSDDGLLELLLSSTCIIASECSLTLGEHRSDPEFDSGNDMLQTFARTRFLLRMTIFYLSKQLSVYKPWFTNEDLFDSDPEIPREGVLVLLFTMNISACPALGRT